MFVPANECELVPARLSMTEELANPRKRARQIEDFIGLTKVFDDPFAVSIETLKSEADVLVLIVNSTCWMVRKPYLKVLRSTVYQSIAYTFPTSHFKW